MIYLLNLGDMGYGVFDNTQLKFFKGISGNANSNLKRLMLSKYWLGYKVVKINLNQLMIDSLDLLDKGYVVFENTQLTNFKGIRGYVNSNLKKGMLS